GDGKDATDEHNGFATENAIMDDIDEQHAVDGESRPHWEAAEKALRCLNQPAKTRMIIREMLASGHVLPAEGNISHATVYSSMLRRDEMFVRLGRGYWGLVEWGENA